MAAVLLIVLGCLIFLSDYIYSSRKIDGQLVRNDYGGGSRTETLEVQIEKEEKVPVEVQISERKYSSREVQDLFQKVSQRMDTLILGNNESLDRIENDMNLVTKIPDEPIEVSWEMDRYDVMDTGGKIQTENLSEEGEIVHLSAILTYTEDEKEQAMYQCAVHVYPKTLTEEEKQRQEVKRKIQETDQESQTSAVLKLPDQIQGKAVSYYREMDHRGLVLIVMGILVGILLYALKEQRQREAYEKRKRQMMRDYPDIINKLTLFLGAGMTVKRAWKKVVEDYMQHQKEGEIRYAYEEMKQTCYEMEGGMTEMESYENFGRRCNVQAYIRLGALLSQNLRKGTKGLVELLKMESIQAFEERKARAKKLGEEAGTKMLIPMFLMLAVVLVIVIVPAFLSMQI